MPTLNQLSSRVANMLNQPNNHELKERVKDMIKTVVANRIRQSVERHGIDDILKLSYIAPVEKQSYKDVFDSQENILNKDLFYATINRVPTPIRFQNDSPFVYVGTLDGKGYTYCSSPSNSRFLLTSYPTGANTNYFLHNGKLIIKVRRDNVETYNKKDISQILITSIWENPDEVISMFSEHDGQDIEIPLPMDVIESSLLEILRVEFNIYPQDLSIKLNNNSQIQS